MEEDALQDAWSLSLANGFKGGKEDFTKLLQSNSNFFDLSFNTFKEKGFEGDKEAYSNLLGVQPTSSEEESKPLNGGGMESKFTFKLPNLDTEDKPASQVAEEQARKEQEVTGEFMISEYEKMPEIAKRKVTKDQVDSYVKEAEAFVKNDFERLKTIEKEFKVLSGEKPPSEGVNPQMTQEYLDALSQEYVDLNRNVVATTANISTAKAQKGTAFGAVQNTLVSEYTKTLEGMTDIVFTAMATIDPQLAGADNREDALKNAREASKRMGVKDILDLQLKDKDTTEEYLERVRNKTIIHQGVLGAAESLFPMMTPAMSGFFAQGYNTALEEVADKEGMSELDKATYSTVNAGITLALEKFGISKIISGAPAVTNQVTKAITNKVFKEAGQDATKETIKRAINTELSQFQKGLSAGGQRFINSFLTEAETGGLQELSETGLKAIVNSNKGEEIFELPKNSDELINNVVEASVAEGIGGVTFGTIPSIAAGISAGRKDNVRNLTQEQFDDLSEKLKDPVFTEAIRQNLQAQVNLGMDKGEAEATLASVNELADAIKSLPPDTPNKPMVTDLLIEKNRLEREAETAPDKMLYNDLIADVKNQIKDLTTAQEGKAKENKTTVELYGDKQEVTRPEGATDKVNKLFDSRVQNATEKFDKAINDVIKESGLPYYEANELKRVTELRAEKDKTISDLESKRSKALKTKLKGAVKKTSVQNDKDVDGLDDLGISDEELLELEDEIRFEEKTSQAPEVLDQGMVSDGGKNYEITSIDTKKDGSKVVKAKEVIEVTEDNIEDLQSKRKAPLKVGDKVYGTTKRYIGDVAEQIAKDNAVGVFEEKAPKPPKWKTRGTPNKQKVTTSTKTTSSKAKPTIEERTEEDIEKELEEDIKSIEKDQKDFEQAILDELAAKDRNRDLVSLKGNLYQVTRKPDGTFSVSKMREDGKLIGIKSDTTERKAAISQFKRKQTQAEKSDMTQAEKLVEDTKKESEDRILKALDKAIQDTSFTRLRGQANDVVTVLGYTAANATLRGVRAAYKAGVSLKEAIAIQYDKIKGTGITELEFKRFVLENLKPAPQKTQQQDKDETEVVTEDITEGKKENDSYFQELKEVKDSDTKQYWSVSEVPEGTDGTVVRVDGGAAFVKPDGDITGVFKDPDSKKKGVADNILKQAVKQGGKMLDNFDNYLTKVYQRNGFRIVSRTPFNEEFAPEGWNEAEHGKPDVVAMVYDPNNELDIEEKSFDDYDKAIEYRNSVLEKGSKQKIGKVKLSILDSVGDEKAVRKGISDYINDLEKSGRITVNQSANWLKKLNNTNLASEKAVDEFLTDIEKGFKDAATKQKQSNVNSKVKRAGKMARGKSKVGQAAKALSKINAKKIEDENLLDEIEKIADDLLTKSPTTTVADINELLSKYNKEVAGQQKNTPQKSITEKIKDYKKKRAKAETFSQFINLEVERQQIIGEYLDSEQDIDPELVRELEEEIEIDIESNKITTAQLASQSRGNLTRAKNAIDKAVKDGVITEEKAEELNSKLKEQVDIFKKELDKFTVQESKKYKKSVLKLKGLTLDGVEADEVRLLLEAEKVDDAAWLSRFNDAAEAIVSGNIPFKEISDLREFAASKSKRVDNLVDAIKEIDPKGIGVEGWIKRLGTKEAAQRVRNVFKSQRDEIYKMVYQPMSNAFTRAKKMSDVMLKDFLKASTPSIFRNDERGFNRVGMIAQYLREASLVGSGVKADGVEVGNRDIFGIWLGNEAAMDAAGLSKNEKEYHAASQAKSMWNKSERKNIEEFYESLPKTEEGYVDVQALSENYESLLNPRERKILKTAEEVFEKGRDRQEAANLRRGIEFNPQVYYVPTQRKGRKADVDATTKKFDKFSPQAKQGKEKVTESLRPTFGVYPVNIAEMVINYAEDTSLDYVFSEVQPVTNAILNKAISRTKANTIAMAIKGDYNASLDYEKSIGNTPQLLTKLLGARYARSLFDPIRSAIEIVAAFTSIPIKVRSIRGVADTFNRESWDTLRALEELTGADIADFKSGDIERKGVKEAVGRENIFIKVGRYTMSVPEYLTAITGFMPVFRREFQSITGEAFDRKSFLTNKAYKEQNLQAIKDATAKAQELVERIYGSKTKGGTRRFVEAAPSFLKKNSEAPITVNADSPQGRLISFFGNFGYREQGEFFQSLKFIAGDLRNKKGNNAAELANAGGVLMNAITYSYMMGVYYLTSQIMFGDDDEAEEAEKRMEEMFTLKGLRDLITNQLTFLAFSKYGKVSRGAAIAVISALHNMAEDKEHKEILANLLKDNFFINKPINLSSKYDVSVFTGKELLPAVDILIGVGTTVNKTADQMSKEEEMDAVVAADLAIAVMNLSLAVKAGTQLPMSNVTNKMLKEAKNKRKNNKKKPLIKKYNIN